LLNHKDVKIEKKHSSLLLDAVCENWPRCAEKLLANEVIDVNVKDKLNLTPLDLAFKSSERQECANLLLMHKDIKLPGAAYFHKAIEMN